MDQRFWFLLASGRERELAPQTKPKTDERPALVKGKLEEAINLGKSGDRVLARNARNLCRDIRDLYKDEGGDVRRSVAEAEKLLDELKKKQQ